MLLMRLALDVEVAARLSEVDGIFALKEEQRTTFHARTEVFALLLALVRALLNAPCIAARHREVAQDYCCKF